jgi:uncharacterized membrane protein
MLAELPSNPVFLTLLGVVVGGLLGLFGVRQASAAQFKIQRQEWERRDRERDEERRVREGTEKEERDREGTAAVKALAIEALWNSTLLLIVANETKASQNGAYPRIRLSREQFDKCFRIAMERLQGMNVQQTASAYLGGFGLQRSREGVESARPISADDLIKVIGMSESFLIVFRSLGQDVFSRHELEELEISRRVFQVREVA